MVLRFVALAAGNRPLPVDRIMSVASLGTGPDPLVAPWRRQVSGRMIDHPRLTRELADQVLGTWSLGPGTISYLQNEIRRRRPSLIFEFGSGISTVCLAQFMADLHGPDAGLRVVSVDQSAQFAQQTRALLERSGLSSLASVVHAPLEEQQISGVTTTCYALPEALDEVIGSRQADLIVIDGPAAEEGARFGTIPLVHRYASPNARFVMDDAMRDGELAIAIDWRSLPFITVDGVRPIEKGLLIGSVHGG